MSKARGNIDSNLHLLGPRSTPLGAGLALQCSALTPRHCCLPKQALQVLLSQELCLRQQHQLTSARCLLSQDGSNEALQQQRQQQQLANLLKRQAPAEKGQRLFEALTSPSSKEMPMSKGAWHGT